MLGVIKASKQFPGPIPGYATKRRIRSGLPRLFPCRLSGLFGGYIAFQGLPNSAPDCEKIFVLVGPQKEREARQIGAGDHNMALALIGQFEPIKPSITREKSIPKR